MIRKAEERDLAAVAALYDAVLAAEERGEAVIGWIRGVYPTARTAADALDAGSLFVCEDAGNIVAAAKLDRTQVPVYAQCAWKYAVPDDAVLVLHTLVVDPARARRGYGRQFAAFYEQYARDHGCRALRLDTNEINTAARRLYASMGYREAGVAPCVFNGIPGVRLVLLEKAL